MATIGELREAFKELLACKDHDRRMILEGMDDSSIQESIHFFIEVFKQVKGRVYTAKVETQIKTVIQLYDRGVIPSISIGMYARYRQIFNILTIGEYGICLSEEIADYWLVKLSVKPKETVDE